VRLDVDGDYACLSYSTPGAETPRPYLEFILAGWTIAARQMIGDDLTVAVEFPHAAPRDREIYRAVFAGGVRFGAPQAGIHFPRSLLEVQLPQSDARLGSALDRDAELLLREIRRPRTWQDQVSRQIQARLPDGEPSLALIARALAVSDRTLRRRLTEEGWTFSAILESTRRKLALRFLEDAETPIDAISAQLGFSETSAFHRAFRRWTHSTPGRFRHRRPAIENS
jgi:AraC-like DNA-binding protein